VRDWLEKEGKRCFGGANRRLGDIYITYSG
jgi:hypothetical protein